MSIVWSNERVLQLIELYQNCECLWDTAHNDYKNTLKKQDAWDSIAKVLNLPVKQVESKVHTIRSQFTRERKKLKTSKKTGSGSDDIVKISWFAYEALLFLIKGETTSGKKDTIEDNVTEDRNEEDLENKENRKNEESLVDITESINQTETKKTSKKRSLDARADEAYDIMINTKKRLDENDAKTDEFDIYGKYVASELRNIKDEYSTLITKQYINNILIEARIGKYRQEYNTYGYKTTQNPPDPSTRNDSPTNEHNILQNNNPDDADLAISNIITHLQD